LFISGICLHSLLSKSRLVFFLLTPPPLFEKKGGSGFLTLFQARSKNRIHFKNHNRGIVAESVSIFKILIDPLT
jgi:hypothetical protein